MEDKEQNYSATLNSHSPRFNDWLSILGGNAVPLLSPIRRLANLGEEKDVYIYNLALDSLKPEQRDRLVQFVASKFGVAPVLVNEDLESLGFPIRAADVDLVYVHRDIGRFQ
jgi:hypothetical protein